MENIRTGLNRVARQYGVEIIDVRIKKADLPDGTPLQSAFDRMRTARQQEAARSAPRAPSGADHPRRGRRRGRADLCRKLRQGPEFYDFYRAMQSYETTFVGGGQGRRRRHHPVAAERLSEGIYWTIALSAVQFAFMRLT
jgi:membrane protease subunit HflC